MGPSISKDYKEESGQMEGYGVSTSSSGLWVADVGAGVSGRGL
jgi:hypothetical protein